mgnify:CR=1 FL=1
MKQGIHPKYVECTVRCTCGNTWVTRSTKSEMTIDLCDKCHPLPKIGRASCRERV